MTPDELIQGAIALVATVPGYEPVARSLRRTRIRFVLDLADRGQATLTGQILVGPESLGSDSSADRISLAGTLIHEHYHTRQHPLLKTGSFWRGIATRSHPMRRYERPAYQSQADFLQALAEARPELREVALHERRAALDSFHSLYGG